MTTRTQDPRPHGAHVVTSRRAFVAGTAAVGAGIALTRAAPFAALAASRPQACNESVQDIINIALVAEQLATTFYYTGLTTPKVVSDRRVAGSSANPNAVAANGDREDVAYLQAALDQERKHARLLASLGAISPYQQFYFPASTFERLGFTSHTDTYLWVLDHLETAFISAYIAAIKRFSALGRTDLAILATRILGVECQHRALYRVISEDDPADNIMTEVAEFSCVSEAADVLKPFLTGRGFSRGSTRAIPLPTGAQTSSIVGRNVSI